MPKARCCLDVRLYAKGLGEAALLRQIAQLNRRRRSETVYYPCLGTYDAAQISWGARFSAPVGTERALESAGDHATRFLVDSCSEVSGWFRARDQWPLFIVLSKFKISPRLVQEKRDGEGALGFAVDRVNSALRAWETASKDRGAAVGMSLGWSEVGVLASASSASELLLLVRDLRCLTWRPKATRPQRHDLSHVFSASLSRVLYSPRIVAEPDVLRARPGATASQSLVLTPSFRCYPGHEGVLCERILDFVSQLDQPGVVLPKGISGPLLSSRMGRYDLVGPSVEALGRPFEPAAVRVIQDLRRFVATGRNGREGRGVLHLMATATQVGLPSPLLSGKHVPREHMVGRQELQGCRERLKRLEGAFERVLASVRCPETLTEQLTSTLAKTRALLGDEIHWPEALGLIAALEAARGVFFDISSQMKRAAREEQEAGWLQRRPREEELLPSAETLAVSTRLRSLLGDELPAFLRTTRSTLHHRHLTGFLTDEVPDRNLRHDGAIQQPLDVAAMVADLAVRRIVGRRPSLVRVGDQPNPSVRSCLDVVLVELDTTVLRRPWRLETVFHEVGNMLLVELEAPGPWWQREHGDAPVRKAWKALRNGLYFGQRVDDILVEAIADQIERACLGVINTDGRASWIRSWLERQTAAMKARSVDREGCGRLARQDLEMAFRRLLTSLFLDVGSWMKAGEELKDAMGGSFLKETPLSAGDERYLDSMAQVMPSEMADAPKAWHADRGMLLEQFKESLRLFLEERLKTLDDQERRLFGKLVSVLRRLRRVRFQAGGAANEDEACVEMQASALKIMQRWRALVMGEMFSQR